MILSVKRQGLCMLAFNMLLSKFGQCTVDVKKNLFMTYCSSLYCCSLWSAYENTTLRSIHVAHNDVLRFMFHL